MRSFVAVGKVADVKPGKLVAFRANGVQIAVANAGGRLYAIDEMCTHELCSLVEEGFLDGTAVICGCHNAMFDLTSGQVLAPPAVEPVKVYPVQVEDGKILVEV